MKFREKNKLLFRIWSVILFVEMLFLAWVLLYYYTPVFAAENPNVICLDSNTPLTGSTTGPNVSSSQHLAQTFFAENDITLTAVSLLGERDNDPTGTFTFDILTTSGGVPQNTPILGNGNFAIDTTWSPNDESGTFDCELADTLTPIQYFELITPVQIESQTTYAIRMKTNVGPLEMNGRAFDGNDYSGGLLYVSTDSGSTFNPFGGVSNWDMPFGVYGFISPPDTPHWFVRIRDTLGLSDVVGTSILILLVSTGLVFFALQFNIPMLIIFSLLAIFFIGLIALEILPAYLVIVGLLVLGLVILAGLRGAQSE